VYLCFEESCARLCAATMLGLTESEATEMGEESVHDAIGELTNMVAGAFKNGLCDSGFPCKLTIPSILRGRDVCVEPTSTVRRHAYAFETQRQEIVADILMKSGA
jgi:chemotaxis protein CheX